MWLFTKKFGKNNKQITHVFEAPEQQLKEQKGS